MFDVDVGKFGVNDKRCCMEVCFVGCQFVGVIVDVDKLVDVFIGAVEKLVCVFDNDLGWVKDCNGCDIICAVE